MKEPGLAPELLEAIARGALRGDAPAWETEGRAGVVWAIAQVVEIKGILKALAKAWGVKFE